jgi:hypothetical protein
MNHPSSITLLMIITNSIYLEEKPDHSLHRRLALRPPPFLPSLQINYMTSADWHPNSGRIGSCWYRGVFIFYWYEQMEQGYNSKSPITMQLIKYMQNAISFLYTGILVLDYCSNVTSLFAPHGNSILSVSAYYNNEQRMRYWQLFM